MLRIAAGRVAPDIVRLGRVAPGPRRSGGTSGLSGPRRVRLPHRLKSLALQGSGSTASPKALALQAEGEADKVKGAARSAAAKVKDAARKVVK
jgi:hypothetical protein